VLVCCFLKSIGIGIGDLPVYWKSTDNTNSNTYVHKVLHYFGNTENDIDNTEYCNTVLLINNPEDITNVF